MNKSQQRRPANKFDLDDNQIMLKKMLARRAEELSNYLENRSPDKRGSVFGGQAAGVHSSLQIEKRTAQTTAKKSKQNNKDDSVNLAGRKSQKGIKIRCLSRASSSASSSDGSQERGAAQG